MTSGPRFEQTCLLVCGDGPGTRDLEEVLGGALIPRCITHLARPFVSLHPHQKRGDPRCSAISSLASKGVRRRRTLGQEGGSSGSGCFLAYSPLHPLPMGPQVEKVTPALCQWSQGREFCEAVWCDSYLYVTSQKPPPPPPPSLWGEQG